jgi:hypothetical protein
VLWFGVVVVVGQDKERGGLEAVRGLMLVHLGDVREDVVERCLYEVIWLNWCAAEKISQPAVGV